MSNETEKTAADVVAELEKEVGEAMKEIGDVAESATKAYVVLNGSVKSTDDIVDVVASVFLRRSKAKLPWYAPMPLVKMAMKQILHAVIKNKNDKPEAK